MSHGTQHASKFMLEDIAAKGDGTVAAGNMDSAWVRTDPAHPRAHALAQGLIIDLFVRQP